MKRYLAIPGCLLLITAFVRATVNFEWDALNYGVAAAGAVILLITLAINRAEVVAWFRDPRGIFAVTTGISVAVFIAVLVVMNIAVWYNPWSVDLTASGRNQVSEETLTLLSRVETGVSLRQFGRASADPRVEQVLQTFARENPLIRVEFADVDRERAQATLYGIVRLGTVVVVAGEKFRKVEDPHEQSLVTAILQVTSDETRTACFVTGHGERALADTGGTGLAGLGAILEASNYRPQSITLDAGVPADCAAVVMAGPRQAYSEQELAQLTDYTDVRQGRVLVLLEPDPAPSFAEWLRPRGVEPGAGTIVDSSASQRVGGGPETTAAAVYPDHPATRDFNFGAIFEGARPLGVVEQPEYGGRPAPLARTGGGEPVNLAVATSIGPLATPERQMRVAVYGDSDFVANEFIRRGGGANRDLFLRTLAWLLGEQEATIVAVDPLENRRLELTARTQAWMYLINLGLLPLIPLVAGIVLYIRSRR
jgi:hypothetical protein